MPSKVDYDECRRLRTEGWMLPDLAARYGVTKQRICQICRGLCSSENRWLIGLQEARKRRTAISKERGKQARSLFAKGYDPKTIAQKIGVSPNTVYLSLPCLQTSKGRRVYRPIVGESVR